MSRISNVSSESPLMAQSAVRFVLQGARRERGSAPCSSPSDLSFSFWCLSPSLSSLWSRWSRSCILFQESVQSSLSSVSPGRDDYVPQHFSQHFSQLEGFCLSFLEHYVFFYCHPLYEYLKKVQNLLFCGIFSLKINWSSTTPRKGYFTDNEFMWWF